MNFPVRKSRQELVDYLARQGNNVDPKKVSTLLGLESTPSPWYIQGLLGFSAWLSAFFFLLFLVITFRDSSAMEMIVAGILFAIFSIVLYRAKSGSVFVSQLTVIFSIVGLILFEIGLGRNLNSFSFGTWRLLAFTVIIFELVVFVMQPDNIRRYIAINNITLAFLFLIHTRYNILSFQIAYTLLAVLTLVTWEGHSRLLRFRGHWQSVIRFAMPMLLLVLLMITLLRDVVLFRLWSTGDQAWWPSTLAIGLVFIGLLFRIYNRLDIINKSHLLFSIVLVLLVGALTYHSPGIIAALFVLVLAYAHGNRILLAFSLVFLGVFIGFYYYNMQLSLLDKSISLMATGGLLLFAARVSQRLTNNSEVANEK